MKHLISIILIALVVLVTSSVLAAQSAQIDGADQWRIAPDGELNGLSLEVDASLSIANAHKGESASFTSSIIKAPFPFTALGAHWQVEAPGDSHFELLVSTSVDGYNFGPFRPLLADPHLDPARRMPDGALNPRYGDTLSQLYLHPRSDGQFFRYRITLGRDATSGLSSRVRQLSFTVIDARASNLPESTTEPSRVISNEYPKPPVISRAAWGARPATCNYAYCTTTHVGVHHTASVSDYSCSGFSECAAVVRAVQTFHMDGNGWCDLGYNYLATPDGTLWEGRGGGDDVRGAHDGQNCGSMGVSNVGYFHPPFNQLWTNAQQDAVAELTAWKSSAQGIAPFGADFYAGLGSVMDNIYGHRDVSATACPGDNIYDFLPDLRSLVDSKLTDESPEFVFDTNAVNVLTDNWSTGTTASDKYGANYLWTSTGDGEVCGWELDLETSGLYEVFLWWPAGSNRSPEAQVFVKRPRVDKQFTVDQRIDGGRWNAIGSFFFRRGEITIGVTNSAPTGDVVMCDALMVVPLN